MATLQLAPLPIKDANALVALWHRHHKPVVGALFAIGLTSEGEWAGAAIIGRPTAQALQDGYTAEVVRLVTDGSRNACSMLYQASWRTWRAMGGTRLITYILASESGGSLTASGWKFLYVTKDQHRNRPSRVRTTERLGQKQLWEASPATPQREGE